MFDESFGRRPLCGLDEAGRGPLAGPLVAVAIILDPKKAYKGVDDSKKLTPARREELYPMLVEEAIAWAVSVKSSQDVDRLNPLACSMDAMREALLSLKVVPALALVDGNSLPALPVPAQAVVRGDSLSLSIAAASVVAKVTRDRIMVSLNEEYPGYGFDRHKGYGTKEHLEAIKRLGPSPVHRLSYRGVLPPGDPPGGGLLG
jgi:ribonuclease HII